MQCMLELFFRLGELRCDSVQSGQKMRLNCKTFFFKFSTCLLLYVNNRISRGESIRNLFYSKILTYLACYINTRKIFQISVSQSMAQPTRKSTVHWEKKSCYRNRNGDKNGSSISTQTDKEKK